MDEINSQLPDGERCAEYIEGDEFSKSAVVWMKTASIHPDGEPHYKAKLRESVSRRAMGENTVIPAPLPYEILEAIHRFGYSTHIEQEANISAFQVTAVRGDTQFTHYTKGVADALLLIWYDVKQEERGGQHDD